jgi:hypothetical protein
MQQYQEDAIGVTDVAKELARAHFLPWERMKYDPAMWSVSRGGINVGQMLPFRSGGMLNNRLTRGIGNIAKGGMKKFGWGKAVSESDTYKDIKNIIGKGRAATTNFDNDFFSTKDGWLRTSTTRLQDTSIQKGLMEKSRSLGKQVRNYSSDIAKNRASLATATAGQAAAKTGAPGRGVYGQSRAAVISAGKSNIAGLTDDIAASTKGASAWQRIYTLNQAKYSQEATMLRKITGARMLRIGHGAAWGLGHLGIRAGILIGKASAAYAVGSLVYQGVKSIVSPVAAAGVKAADQTFSSLQSLANPELGGQLELGFLSQGAATERQRAVQAISKSRINGRSMLGYEGAAMHR